VSKPSAVENRYFDHLGAWLQSDWRPSPIYRNERAVGRNHPRGVAEWGTGAGMKAHHWFAVGLSKRAHLEYDADHDGFEKRHRVTHANLVRDQWQAMQIIPGPWMGVGMAPKPAQWFERVLDRVLANGMSDYERAVFGK
jgi:hypothetical protein